MYLRKSSEAEDRQVLSIESQEEALRELAREEGLEVVRVFREVKSAKEPGRVSFNEMMDEIRGGKAQGILCWKLNRLARNPIDAGSIAWELQQGRIQRIRTYERAYLPTDNVMMMSVEFGLANQFIRDLSTDVKRGLLKKARMGWLPTKAPIGYRNEKHGLKGEKRVLPDPESFDRIQRCWELLLTGKYSVEKIYRTAVEDWDVRLSTGKKPVRSKFYDIFRNPFYYGWFRYGGEWYQGQHPPMITRAEFDAAQAILDGRSVPRQKEHEFAFTGLIRCGECGGMITAEEKTKHQKNGNAHHYVYYHCTKRKAPCSQKTIRVEELERQIEEELLRIEIPEDFADWILAALREENAKEAEARDRVLESQQRAYSLVVKKLNGLVEMRAGGELTQEEFLEKKAELTNEKIRLSELLGATDARVDEWLERAEELLAFAHGARVWFREGTLRQKGGILAALGSNLLLEDKILRIEAVPALRLIGEMAPRVRTQKERLEPIKFGSTKTKSELDFARISGMSG